MRYYVRASPLRRMMVTRTIAAPGAPGGVSPAVMNGLLLIGVALGLYALYMLYLMWDPVERPMRHVVTEEEMERIMEDWAQSTGGPMQCLVERQSYQHPEQQPQWQYQQQHVDHPGANEPYIPTRYRRKRLTPRQRRIVMERTNYCCSHCGSYCPVYDRELNHRISLSSNLYRYYNLNDLGNYELLCRRCHGLQTYLQRQRGEFRH